MESAIPQHLVSRRTEPTRMKPDWHPPYPSFVARFTPSVARVAMAYFGVQYRSGSEPPAIARAALVDLAAACSGPDGPGWADRAAYVDEAGYDTVITIAYWDDPGRHERWSADARAMWLGARHASGDAGFFLESVRPSTARCETLFSNDRLEGVARLAGTLSGEVAEHAYWGGARDRLPLAQTDPLAPGDPPRGDRRRQAAGGRGSGQPLPDPFRSGLERHRRQRTPHVPRRRRTGTAGRPGFPAR